MCPIARSKSLIDRGPPASHLHALSSSVLLSFDSLSVFSHLELVLSQFFWIDCCWPRASIVFPLVSSLALLLLFSADIYGFLASVSRRVLSQSHGSPTLMDYLLL